ncbi:MAG: hypothetical protein MUF15_26340 [Acidobacteria bacterium]|jgi:hypothetical protein|nr:hypothetical protein [Acidobacteriota bacterium]
MAELKMMQGILALVDIVNFTGQATKLSDKYTAQYIDYFQARMTAISGKYGFTIVKSMGDAVLFFGTSPEGILNIMVDLFHTDKPEDKFGFISRFRMVAHSGFFQFEAAGDKLIDLISPEGIKVFRMEKFAQSWELVVTQSLYQGIKPLLTKKNIEAVRMVLNEPLKGFDSEEWNPPFYKLRVLKENFGVSNLLEQRINELENHVQSIPVFGSIYPPVPMEKNFINLSLVCDDDRFLKQLAQGRRGKGNTGAEADKDYKIKKRHLPKGEWPLHDLDREEEYNRRSKIDDIDVSTLYEIFCSGIIMGLPGAGKTTILRHLAYKEFKANEALPGDEKRVVLFVQCKDVPFYDKWYQDRYDVAPAEPGEEEALSFMTWSFLFGKKKPGELTPEELVEFQKAEQKVEGAFKTGRLILLVDALDEAQDRDTRERIKQLFYRLHAENNRLYLTSRPSESIHLARDYQAHNIPFLKYYRCKWDRYGEWPNIYCPQNRRYIKNSMRLSGVKR